MKPLRFAIFGCGFWSRYQLAAWREIPGVEPVALYNRTLSKARALAERFAVPAVYDDPARLLDRERPDFVDIITDVATHRPFVELVAGRKIPVICQKPMAPDVPAAEAMLAACRAAGVPLAIHENWRWQHPIRQLQAVLSKGMLGRCFRARVSFCCSFPVYRNQPFLAEAERFILADMGSHVLDTARFLFGEADSLYCRTARVNQAIKGEDVATVMLGMGGGTTVTCELSYASRLEHERFPETYILAECENGSVELGPDYWLRVTTDRGTQARRCPPPRYAWADPAYDLVHSSIVACHADIVGSLREGRPAETSGLDNLRTVRMVAAAYESAERNCRLPIADCRLQELREDRGQS